jgi:hypothetical protein
MLIRNAIAHSSDHAGSLFENKVLGSQLLLPAEKTPAGYLRGRSTATTQTRFEIYLINLAAISATIHGNPK